MILFWKIQDGDYEPIKFQNEIPKKMWSLEPNVFIAQ